MGFDVDTNSEEWRFLCEARHVIKLPNIVARRAYLELIGQRRGIEAKKVLEKTVLDEWERIKAKAAQ